MTIRAEQSEIVLVGCPIAETAAPCPSRLEFLDFLRPVDVIDVKRSEVFKGCRRISEALNQPDLFIEKPKPAKQGAIFE